MPTNRRALLLLLVGWALFPMHAWAKRKRKKANPPVVFVVRIDPETGVGTYAHGCCDCELWHRLELRLVRFTDGSIGVEQTWVVDSDMTHSKRVKRFGVEYLRPRDSILDQWSAEHRDPPGHRDP